MPQTEHNNNSRAASAATTAITPSSHRSRVWAYFTNRHGDPDRVKCNLCSAELHNKGRTGVLWEHVKAKHLGTRKQANQTINNNNNTSTSYTQANHHTKPQANMTNNTATINNTNTNNKKPPNANNLTTTTRTSTYLGLCDQQSGAGAMDLMNEASMKPNPALSSINPRNLISRLNQLSLPVARKLKFWNKKSFQVNQYDPSFKVIYLGNLAIQLWSKEESCLDKPLNTLWNNYLVNMKTEIVMRLTICNSGLKAITRQHGLTQYWSNRLVFCCSHKNYPRVFSWVYRHEGKKMRQELRCHAVFCPSPEKASKMVTMLNQRLACALQEFRREKKARGVNVVVGNDSTAMHMELHRIIPLRRQILAKGSANFRPPLERSKSAPKLFSIVEEDYSSSEDQSQDEEQSESHYIAQVDLGSSFEEDEEEEEEFKDKDDINVTRENCTEATDSRTSTSDTSDRLTRESTQVTRKDHDLINDDSVYSVEDGTTSKEEDEDSIQKLELNSLNTTVNEETSNCSVSTQGDTKLLFDQLQQHQHEQLLDGSLVPVSTNYTPDLNNGPSPHRTHYNVKLTLYPNNGLQEEKKETTIEELNVQHESFASDRNTTEPPTTTTSIFIEPSSSSPTNDTEKTNFLNQNNPQSPLQSSANNNPNSSLRNKLRTEKTILIRNSLPDGMKDVNLGKRATTGATDTNGIGKLASEDAASRDIVLSWSNLVIE